MPPVGSLVTLLSNQQGSTSSRQAPGSRLAARPAPQTVERTKSNDGANEPQYRLRIELFDHHLAQRQRRDSGRHISEDPALLSLDTPTGLPPEVDAEVRQSSSVPAAFTSRDPFELVPFAEYASSGTANTRPLNPSALPFSPAALSGSNFGKPAGGGRVTIESIVPVFTPLRTLDYRFGPISLEWGSPKPIGDLERALQESTLGPVESDSMSPSVTRPVPLRGHSWASASTSTRPLSPISQASEAETLASTVGQGSLALSPSASSMGAGLPVRYAASSSSHHTASTRQDLQSVDLGFGIIHLMREDEQLDLEGPAPHYRRERNAYASSKLQRGQEEQGDGLTLAVLAIPSVMSVADFLRFTESDADSISQIRLLRDAMPNRCMALLRFRDRASADKFVVNNNGRPYWAMMDDEVCHVVRLRSIDIYATTSPPFTFPMSKDHESEITTPSAVAGTHELPTCPLCLERLDVSVTGLITNLCAHTFHCHCLSKWENSRCPVCRYSQTRTKPLDREQPVKTSCDDCGDGSSLWMCLICGHAGCGRYQGKHAYRHFEETGHLYAMELETQRVWDYAGDSYVHRLIQDKTDGKLVELPSIAGPIHNEPTGRGPTDTAHFNQEKMEAMGVEYSHLLSSQLDSQRLYFEDRLNDYRERLGRRESANEQLRHRAEQWESERRELLKRIESAQAAHKSAVQQQTELGARLKQLEADHARDMQRLELRTNKALDLSRSMAKDLASEREQNKGLLANLTGAQQREQVQANKTQELQAQVTDLQEQLRDLMFALTARDKIDAGGGALDELQGGSVGVVQTPSNRRQRARQSK